MIHAPLPTSPLKGGRRNDTMKMTSSRASAQFQPFRGGPFLEIAA
jgi:hypothetical protein